MVGLSPTWLVSLQEEKIRIHGEEICKLKQVALEEIELADTLILDF